MEQNKKRILILSDSPFSNTGFSSQSLFTINGLSKFGYECFFQSHNYMGQTLPRGCVKLADGTPFNFTLYGNGREQYSKDLLIPRIQELRPDYFIILLDTFMLYPWYLQMDFAPAKTLFWFPSDGGNLPQGCEQILQKCSHTVAMAKFGQKQVKDLYGINASYIPHGVNEKLFKPLKQEEKNKIKAQFGLNGRYVVGMMGRNQGRKMHDRAIKMFAKWCHTTKHDDAMLFIHADPYDAAAVFDMSKLISLYGIQNRVIFSGTKFYQGITYQQMNEIYNCMDVYLSTTSGEGFGIGTIEAMSCGIPILITAYTTSDELVTNNNCGEVIKLVGTEYVNLFKIPTADYDRAMINGTITGSWSVERGICDIDDGVNKLEKLYMNPQLRQTYAKNGRTAVIKEYTMQSVINRWNELLLKI